MHEPTDKPEKPGKPAINIRNLSIKCGHCDTYQTLAHFAPRDEHWNVYTYECENDACDVEVTRTYIEVPVELDAFARRDPTWHGGAVHAGAKEPPPPRPRLQVYEYDPETGEERDDLQ